MAFDHRNAAATVDFQQHLGHAYVAPEDLDGTRVLDPARSEALAAWTASIIPGDAHWPSARDAHAAAYIDATVGKAPATRPILLNALTNLERAAQAAYEKPFAACDADQREALLGDFSEVDATGAFDMVLELTFEAYYRDPHVCAVMERRTGFRSELPHTGSPMEPFDEARLERVKSLPPRYRQVPE
jgi:hypothetical protein